MTVMHGAFDPRVPFPTGPTMLVGGPFKWDGDDPALRVPAKKITIESVVVTQAVTNARATAQPHKNWDRPDTIATDHWPAKLNIVGEFELGAARAVVVAHVRLVGANTEQREEWQRQFDVRTAGLGASCAGRALGEHCGDATARRHRRPACRPDLPCRAMVVCIGS